jgi:hypothetical protein
VSNQKIIVFNFEKIFKMKNQVVSIIFLVGVMLISSCAQKLSLHKKHYSDGYYVNFFKTKKSNSNQYINKSPKKIDETHTAQLEGNVELEEQYENESTSITNIPLKTNMKSELDFSHKSNTSELDIKSENKLNKKSNKIAKLLLPSQSRKYKKNQSGPFFGFLFEKSANLGYIIGAVISLIVTIAVLAFIFSFLELAAFGSIILLPIILVILLIALLAVIAVVIFNTD